LQKKRFKGLRWVVGFGRERQGDEKPKKNRPLKGAVRVFNG